MANQKKKIPCCASFQSPAKKANWASFISRLLSFLLSSKKIRRFPFLSFLDAVVAKESLEEMACDRQEFYDTNPFFSTPPATLLSASPSRPRNPKESDQCFTCRRFGHWAQDCPSKTPKKSQASSPGSSSSPSVHVPDLPVVRCPCGRGTCKVKTSCTDKNPGRKFYACPVDLRTSVRCNFFKWSDEIVARFKPPMCQCGAGSCSLNIVSSGPDRDRWYFACRIKKNHGACQFFQWADSVGNNMLNMHVDESNGYSARRSLFADPQVLTVKNEPCKEDDQNSDIELESAMGESFDNASNSSMASPSAKDEIPVIDLGMQDSESSDLVVGTALQVPPLIPKSVIPCQGSEFSLRISSAGHPTSEEGAPPFDPVIEDTGDIEGQTLVADSSLNDDESDIPQGPLLQSTGKDAEHPNSVFQEPSGMKIVVQKNGISTSALKTYGQGLLDILQSMDQTQHETMLKVAETTFDTLSHLSIDYASFSKDVMEYIQCKSKLAGIEESMGKPFSSEEFLGHYNDKKTEFDEVSQLHVVAESAYEASESRLQSLRGEVSRVKNMLLELERQLSFCEDETCRFKSRVTEISKNKSESERSFDAACAKMGEALKLEHEWDSIANAANAALENARVQLLQ